MNCQLCQKESEAYHEGKVSPDLRAQIEFHLSECNKCLEIFNVQILALRIIDHEKELCPNPFIVTRIMTQLDNVDSSAYRAAGGLIKVLRPALIVTSLAAAVFFGIIIGNIYRPSETRYLIPLELKLINDASIEAVDVFSFE
jgi:predicted anti-sigma-YlaC factor YlaD